MFWKLLPATQNHNTSIIIDHKNHIDQKILITFTQNRHNKAEINMDQLLHQISELIKSRRKELSIKQEDLAELTQVAIRTIRDLEKGIGNPSLQTLQILLAALEAVEAKKAARELAAQRSIAAYGVATDDAISFELVDGGALDLIGQG